MAEQYAAGYYSTPFKFSGKERDDYTGLHYFGARYYDSRTSIWMSVDPLVEETMDAYGYCYQNPINVIDPTGMKGEGGHSIANKILKQPVDPPQFLYHGTTKNSLNSIVEMGLLPMERQYVHLSVDENTASIVGSRRKGELVVLKGDISK